MIPETKRQGVERETPAGEEADHVPLQKALLQKHRALNSQFFVTQCGGRAVCLLAIAFLAIAPSLSVTTTIAVCTAFFLLLVIWSRQEKRLQDMLDAIELALAGAAGGKWEDAFIKSRNAEGKAFYSDNDFLDRMATLYVFVASRERVMWILMLAAVLLIRMYAPGLFGVSGIL